jgi:hypothetical protein
MNEFSSVGAGNFGSSNVAVGEPTNLVDVGLEVVFGIGTLDQVAVFEGLAGCGIDGRIDEVITVGIAGVVKCGVVGRGLALG